MKIFVINLTLSLLYNHTLKKSHESMQNMSEEINEGLIPIVNFRVNLENINFDYDMSEIRNLTRNGETFYPLTTSSAVINEATGEGLVIDNEPTAGSHNLVESGGVAKPLNDINLAIGLNVTQITDFTAGKYVNNYGYTPEHAGYSMSDAVLLTKETVISIRGKAETSVAIISKYKGGSEPQYIPLLAGRGLDVDNYTYTLNDDAYIVISISNEYSYSVEAIHSELTDRIEDIEQLKEYFNETELSEPSMIIGSYISIYGSIVVHADYRYSSPIYMKAGTIVSINSYYDNSVSIISQTDSEGSYYRSLEKGNGSIIQKEVTIYENGYYAFTCNTGSILLKKGVLNDVYSKDNIEKYKNFGYFFEDAIFIGDSLTQGIIYDYPRLVSASLPKYSYPEKMAKMLNINAINAGVGGIDAVTWLNDEYSKYDFTEYQVCFIELFENGTWVNERSSDPTTNEGAFEAIISGIKQQNPNILIVAVLSHDLDISYNPRYEFLKSLCSTINIPYIDLTKSDIIDLKDYKYHGNGSNDTLDGLHFNAIGYTAKAIVVSYYLGLIIDKNAKLVNNSAFNTL